MYFLFVHSKAGELSTNTTQRPMVLGNACEKVKITHDVYVHIILQSSKELEIRLKNHDAAIFLGFRSFAVLSVALAKALPEKQFCLVTGAPCSDAWKEQVGLNDPPDNLLLRRFPDDPTKTLVMQDMADRVVKELTQRIQPT